MGQVLLTFFYLGGSIPFKYLEETAGLLVYLPLVDFLASEKDLKMNGGLYYFYEYRI